MILLNIEGQKVYCTEGQQTTIGLLETTRKGGFATVEGYMPESGWKVRPVQNIQFLTRFNTSRLYERRINALKGITFDDVFDYCAEDEKLSLMDTEELREVFNARLEKEIASMEKTLDGDRSDAHRQGHDRCYIHLGDGIKVNLVTEKGTDGLKHPVLYSGIPVVDNIMVSALFINVKTITEGERKVVNSGAPVRMGNCINRVLNQRSVGLKMLSLKDDNYDGLAIDGYYIMPELVEDLVA